MACQLWFRGKLLPPLKTCCTQKCGRSWHVKKIWGDLVFSTRAQKHRKTLQNLLFNSFNCFVFENSSNWALLRGKQGNNTQVSIHVAESVDCAPTDKRLLERTSTDYSESRELVCRNIVCTGKQIVCGKKAAVQRSRILTRWPHIFCCFLHHICNGNNSWKKELHAWIAWCYLSHFNKLSKFRTTY